MAKGILLVQTRPSSPDDDEAYHRWYDEAHIPEILGVDGFVTARRFRAVDDADSYVVVYEVDDVEAAQEAMSAAHASGKMSPPVGVQVDPPPSVQWFTALADSGS